MHLFYAPDIKESQELPQEEAQHAVRVLRLNEGEEISVTDGKGHFYTCRIAAATSKHCMVSILDEMIQEPLWSHRLEIAVAPTKNMDRMEWLAEKATEIGLDSLTFLDCAFSERRVVKVERIEKILISAMKQSLKARLPQCEGMVRFKDFIRRDFKGQKFICHCYKDEKRDLKDLVDRSRDAVVLIGPEGDFSEDEVREAIKAGFEPVSLGPSRLRTETAALVSCHILNLSHQ